mmetsp:Transcript_2117/g.7680  ORF Transcript_2117/g.7680 Transcript_2117/m.7680 type:complete len:93 (+) Transcript_2117:32-310(+)
MKERAATMSGQKDVSKMSAAELLLLMEELDNRVNTVVKKTKGLGEKSNNDLRKISLMAKSITPNTSPRVARRKRSVSDPELILKFAKTVPNA